MIRKEIIAAIEAAIADQNLISLSEPRNENELALKENEETFYSITAEYTSGDEQQTIVDEICHTYPDYA